MNKNTLVMSVVILGSLAFITGAVAFAFPELDDFVKGYLVNISSGFFVTILITISVDQIIKKNQEQDKIRIVKMAFWKLRGHVGGQLGVIGSMLKEVGILHFPIFEDYSMPMDVYDKLKHFDYSAEAPVITPNGKIRWLDYLENRGLNFYNYVQNILDIYISYLDHETIESFEKIMSCTYMNHIIKDFPAFGRMKMAHFCFFDANGEDRHFLEYIHLLIKIALITDKYSVDGTKFNFEQYEWLHCA